MTRAALILLVFCLLTLSPVSRAGAADPVDTLEMMPLEEVRPGMQAVVHTVFEASDIEEFQAEIIDVMPNFLGPGQDLILARLRGERVEYTGVAAGMSGSPVYIDGRLIGALSYRIGSFMKEPIAGITPIAAMLDIERGGGTSSGGTGGVATLAASQWSR